MLYCWNMETVDMDVAVVDVGIVEHAVVGMMDNWVEEPDEEAGQD